MRLKWRGTVNSKKLEALFPLWFLVLGLVLLIVGIILSFFVFDYRDTVETVGTISQIETEEDSDGDSIHKVYITYEADGKMYESRLYNYSSGFSVGKEVNIYYHKGNPGKIGMKSMDLVFLVFPILGLIFFSIGGIPLLLKLRAKKTGARLLEEGFLVEARYIKTEENRFYSVNRQHPYRIICEWEDPCSHEKHIFKSKNLWENPLRCIAEKGITSFPVYMDRGHSKKYIMDVSACENAESD